MNLKKILAGVAAGALAVGATAFTAFADEMPYEPDGTENVLTELHTSQPTTLDSYASAWYSDNGNIGAYSDSYYIKVTVSDIGDYSGFPIEELLKWDDITTWFEFAIYQNDDNKIIKFPVMGATTDHAVVYFPLSEIEGNPFSFNIQAGHVGFTIDKVEVVEYKDDGKKPGEGGEEVDTSAWVIELKAFNNNWNGWQGAKSEPGALKLTTTVKELIAANAAAGADVTIDNLMGINLEVNGTQVGDVVYYNVTVNDKEPVSGKATIAAGDNGSANGYVATLNMSDYSFAEDDVISVVVSAKEITNEKRKYKNLWTGEAIIGIDWATIWDKMAVIEAEEFADVVEGDTVTVTFTLDDEATYSQLQILDGKSTPLTSPEGLNEYDTIDVKASPFSFVLNADDLALVQANDMRVGGYNVTILSVDLNLANKGEDGDGNNDDDNDDNKDDDKDDDNTGGSSSTGTSTSTSTTTTTTASSTPAEETTTTTQAAPAASDNNGAGAGNTNGAANPDKNAATGVAIAFIPALAAAAGVIISKKRK